MLYESISILDISNNMQRNTGSDIYHHYSKVSRRVRLYNNTSMVKDIVYFCYLLIKLVYRYSKIKIFTALRYLLVKTQGKGNTFQN